MVYMFVICADSGIILSNSVLRAIHNELDWCVRNSYSPHHHENIGRCVLHAAHLSCTSELQGEQYQAFRAPEAGALQLEPALADAVTVHPLDQSHRFYQLHAYISRVTFSMILIVYSFHSLSKLSMILFRNRKYYFSGIF